MSPCSDLNMYGSFKFKIPNKDKCEFQKLDGPKGIIIKLAQDPKF